MVGSSPVGLESSQDNLDLACLLEDDEDQSDFLKKDLEQSEEQLLDKLLVVSKEHQLIMSAEPQEWEESFNELFPDLV